MLVDSHTHLYLEQFDDDRNEVIERAIRDGVNKMFLPNIDSGTIEALLDLCGRYPDNCYPMAGLHPTSVKDNYREELGKVKSLLDRGGYIAVGEVGIDLYWDKTYLREQEEAFGTQIEWAVEKDLPVVIHARESFDEIFRVLDSRKSLNPRGVFHSFTGNTEQLKQALSYDFYIGINGIVTFKNSGLMEVVKDIPLERLLLETDSPFLSPVPNRGKRNESSHLKYIARKVADIKGLEYGLISEITSSNALSLFKIPNG
jgi:TatD DNase family protein